MDAPDAKDTSAGVNGLALAAFVLGAASVWLGTVGGGFGVFGADGWLFAISLVTPAAGLTCAYLARQQMQLGTGAVRGAWFAVAGAILAVVGALTNTLTYLRIQELGSPFGSF